MDAETREYLDRMFGTVAHHFEVLETRMNERFDALERRMDRLGARMDRLEHRMDALATRMDALEDRMDALERRVESMDFKFTEKFIGVDERFASARLATEQFETRVLDALETMRDDLARLNARVTALEENLVRLNDRVDALAEDMRQRFRVVNERLAAAA